MISNRIKLGNGTWDAALRLESGIEVNVGNINTDRTEADISGDTTTEITACIATLNSNGFNPTDLGSVTPPTPITPDTPPTADELTRDSEVVTAFNTVMDAEVARIKALVNTEYDNISTTTEPFKIPFDIKHLRQRVK